MSGSTMKALKWFAEKDQVEIVQAKKPELSKAENILVKVAYCGVCGTDLHIMLKEFAAAEEVILGHEMSGVVVEVGDDVRGLKVGDQVAVNPNSGCGKCKFCLKGRYNYCVTGGLRSTLGIFSDGGWAEYCEVPGHQASVLPAGVSLMQGILCEPLSCVIRGWDNNGRVDDDAEILVIGTGIIGLLWIVLFYHHGYRNVTVSELNEERIKFVQNLGFGFKICHPKEIEEKFVSLEPEVHGYELIVDCSGSATAFQSAFPWLCRGGKLNVFGCCPKKSTAQVNPAEFMLREASIIGSLINPYKFPTAVQLVGTLVEYLTAEKLGMKVFELSDYEEAFKALKDGSVSKAIFKIAD